MKKIIFSLFIFVVALPLLSYAHTGEATEAQDPGFIMMGKIEDRIMGDKLHEEMESLMTQMLSGNLSEGEVDRIGALMQEYPGPGSMMLGRMMDERDAVGDRGPERSWLNHNNNFMMGLNGFGGSFMVVFGILFWVLVIFGVMALVRFAMKSGGKDAGVSKDAMNFLKERYAKSEIDGNEYEAKRKEMLS